MVLSNVCVPDVLVLSSSLAIVFRAHLSLQGPLLVEMSGFSLMAAPMKAQGWRKKSIDEKNNDGVQMQTETYQMVPF